MGKLSDRIESRLLLVPGMDKLFPAGASLDTGLSKHLRVRVRRLKEDSHYDVFAVRVQVRSDEPIEEAVHIKKINKSFRRLEDSAVVKKIIPNGFEITNSDLALYNSGHVDFIVITNIEKA